MPLEILGPLVVIGIAGIALLLHLLGLSRQCPLRDENDVARHWARHHPEVPFRSGIIDPTGHNALLHTETGPALMWSFGADTVVKSLSGAEITETENGLAFKFADFGAPSHTVPLSDDDKSHWQDFLKNKDGS